jgi:hypothetical protein
LAGTGAIYRIDANGDLESDAKTAGQIIEFNGGATPDTTGRITEPGIRWGRAVSLHTNPGRILDQVQDNKLSYKEITITGYFVDHDSTVGPDKFDEWMRGNATNASLPFGRFGLRSDDFATASIDLVPTSTKGYILYDVEVHKTEVPHDQVSFIAKLYRNGDPT